MPAIDCLVAVLGGAEVFTHPALVANLHRVVCVAGRVADVTAASVLHGGEGVHLAVGNSCGVLGISTEIVGRPRCEVSQHYAEVAGTSAGRRNLVICCRGLVGGAVAETTSGDVRAAVVGDVAADVGEVIAS